MIKYVKTKIFTSLAVMSLLATASCLQDPSDEVKTADQLFRPILFTATIDGGSAYFSWVPIKNASYSLELSRDSLKFERELQVIPLDSTAGFLVENLWSQSRYSARVKAVSKNPAVKNSEYQTVTFTTGIENIFFKLDTAGVSTDRLRLDWDASRIATHIKILAGTAETTATLSDGEKLAGSRLITGLKPATAYTFRIYNGEMLRGTTSATTRSAP
jgi:hypothetical protein